MFIETKILTKFRQSHYKFPTRKCLLRLGVRTLPFHGKNAGSSPAEDKNTKKKMSLRLWRKKKRFHYPRNYRNKKRHPWYFASVTPKMKKLFSKNQKMYSAELRSPLLISFLRAKKIKINDLKQNSKIQVCLTPPQSQNEWIKTNYNLSLWYQWRNQNLEKGRSIWRCLFFSRFWIFNHPIAVPGTIKIRRSKGLFAIRQNATHNLNFWLNRIGFRWCISIYYKSIFLRKQHPSIRYLTNLESFWPLLVYKIRLALSVENRTQILKNQRLIVNGRKTDQIWSIGNFGDLFHIPAHKWQNKIYFQTFTNKMFSLFLSFYESL